MSGRLAGKVSPGEDEQALAAVGLVLTVVDVNDHTVTMPAPSA